MTCGTLNVLFSAGMLTYDMALARALCVRCTCCCPAGPVSFSSPLSTAWSTRSFSMPLTNRCGYSCLYRMPSWDRNFCCCPVCSMWNTTEMRACSRSGSCARGSTSEAAEGPEASEGSMEEEEAGWKGAEGKGEGRELNVMGRWLSRRERLWNRPPSCASCLSCLSCMMLSAGAVPYLTELGT